VIVSVSVCVMHTLCNVCMCVAAVTFSRKEKN
jgi:hypothetical protein